METSGMGHDRLSAEEVSAALQAAGRSRTRVAWVGYPTWYWLVGAAGLAVLPASTLLPDNWAFLVLTANAVVVGALVFLAYRLRGVRESSTRMAMTGRDVLLLFGPAFVVLLAGAITRRFVWWSPIPAAVLVFALIAGTGLLISKRVTRR